MIQKDAWRVASGFSFQYFLKFFYSGYRRHTLAAAAQIEQSVTLRHGVIFGIRRKAGKFFRIFRGFYQNAQTGCGFRKKAQPGKDVLLFAGIRREKS